MTGEDLSLRQRATLVEALSSSLEHGGTALGTVPKALRRLLEQDAWREFTTSRGEHVTYDRFADFVTTRPLRGLGSDIALVKRIVATDPIARDLLDQALQNRTGPQFHDNVMESEVGGNSQAQALRRLRKDAPELHAEVLAGRLTAHAAMVQAGFRPKTVTVPVTRPDTVARMLRKHMTPGDLTRLADLLTEQP